MPLKLKNNPILMTFPKSQETLIFIRNFGIQSRWKKPNECSRELGG